MFAAIAQSVEQMRLRQERRDGDDGAGAGEPEHERDQRPFGIAAGDEQGFSQAPDEEAGEPRMRGFACAPDARAKT